MIVGVTDGGSPSLPFIHFLYTLEKSYIFTIDGNTNNNSFGQNYHELYTTNFLEFFTI